MESMRINLQDIAWTKVRAGQEEGNYYFQKIKRHSSKGSPVYPPGRNTQVYFCPGKLFLDLRNVTLVTASLRSLLSIRLLSNSLCYVFLSFLLLIPEEDIFSSPCPLPKYCSNPPALPENAQHISGFKRHSCNHSEGQRAAQISFQYPFQLFDNARWAELQMKPVVQMKYELLLCPEKQVVYVRMRQREEGYEISWVSVVREV